MQQNAQTNAMAQEPVLNMPVAQQRRASEPAAPYIGQLVTKISVKGNKITKAEDIEAVVTTKPGMQLTQEALPKICTQFTVWAGIMICSRNLPKFRKACSLHIMYWKTLFIKSWK